MSALPTESRSRAMTSALGLSSSEVVRQLAIAKVGKEKRTDHAHPTSCYSSHHQRLPLMPSTLARELSNVVRLRCLLGVSQSRVKKDTGYRTFILCAIRMLSQRRNLVQIITSFVPHYHVPNRFRLILFIRFDGRFSSCPGSSGPGCPASSSGTPAHPVSRII